MSTKLVLTAGLLLSAFTCPAQNPPDVARGAIREANERIMQAAPAGTQQAAQDYRIGPEDLIDISVFDVPEMSRTVRVSATGDVSLPLIGQVRASGLTPAGLEGAITTRLKEGLIKDPQVSVFVREFKSDSVSVIGAVQLPGTYQIQTPKKLLEVLAMAHGFSAAPNPPGREIVISRKRPMAPDADSAAGGGDGNTVKVPIAELIKSTDDKWNVTIYPGDTIRVIPAASVYVAGDVARPGAFPLSGFDNISAVQALAMAGGFTKSAKGSNAVVIHNDIQGNRTEQAVNLSRVLQGKEADFLLRPNDILFVPGSMSKTAAIRAIEAGIQITTGVLIWRR